jgi:FkbM family methyltransferase
MESLKTLGRSALRNVLPVLPRGRTRLLEGLSGWLMPRGGIETRRIGRYALRLDHRIRAMKLMAYDVYEAGEVRLFRRFLRPGDVVLDLGANVGYMAVQFAACVGPTGRVHAFEPAPTCVAALEEMASGCPDGVIEVVAAAVGRETGQTTYFETEKIMSHGFGRIGERPSAMHQVTHEVLVPVYRVDDYCRERGIARVTFVKIDVEGAELDVVEGMSGLFQTGQKPGLLTEVTLHETAPPELIALRDRLFREGYGCYRLQGERLVLCDPGALPPRTHDNVFWFCQLPAGLAN